MKKRFQGFAKTVARNLVKNTEKDSAKNVAVKSFSALTNHLSLWHEVLRDHSILDKARNRTVVGALIFCAIFALISLRLFDVMVFRSTSEKSRLRFEKNVALVLERSNIVDRHGQILATHLITASVYANPKVILDPKDAAEKLCALLPELDFDTMLKRLSDTNKGFVWILRHIAPKVQYAINNLGIPGVYLEKDQRRVYPFGEIAAHVVGYCGVENLGLSGVEKYFDLRLRKDNAPLTLSLDIRVQHAVHEVLGEGLKEFRAIGGNAMVVDTESGEILSMVSFPGIDPNVSSQNAELAAFNRNTLGVYEPGSTAKIMNTAIALETGNIKLTSMYDAINPVKVGRFKITDFKGPNRMVTVKEGFLCSSNLVSARLAMDFGLTWQRKYFHSLGLLEKPKLEIPEIGAPIYPKNPTEATLISNSFGYAISLSPLQIARAVSAIINDGHMRDLTLLKQKMPILGAPVIAAKTSASMRELMSLVVQEGTGRKARVHGYHVMGKTGTSYKSNGKSYDMLNKITSFVGAFGGTRYLLLVFLDSPRPTPTTYGYSTGGWNAAPIAGRIIERIAPLLGLAPAEDDRFPSCDNIFLTGASHEAD